MRLQNFFAWSNTDCHIALYMVYSCRDALLSNNAATGRICLSEVIRDLLRSRFPTAEL